MENRHEKLIVTLEFLDKLEPYFIFGLAVIGVLGNILSFGIFIFTKFK